ncbi:hypothetical protein QWZ13_15750 [Reinekea marina]|nr:hypothetical protein [Reinekea marina]MDN3650361.1 hypothetical protein [Reinekea marina]
MEFAEAPPFRLQLSIHLIPRVLRALHLKGLYGSIANRRIAR